MVQTVQAELLLLLQVPQVILELMEQVLILELQDLQVQPVLQVMLEQMVPVNYQVLQDLLVQMDQQV